MCFVSRCSPVGTNNVRRCLHGAVAHDIRATAPALIVFKSKGLVICLLLEGKK